MLPCLELLGWVLSSSGLVIHMGFSEEGFRERGLLGCRALGFWGWVIWIRAKTLNPKP